MVLNGTATSIEGYSFGAGVVMYFMLSKSTPFLAPTSDLIIEKTNQCWVSMQYACFERLSHDCRDIVSGLANKAVVSKMKTMSEPANCTGL